MDEFHQIIQISPAAVEALKPLLADSATRGIRVIAATTNREFSEFVEANQPLVERFTQIRLHEPDKATVVAILESMAETYGVSDAIIGTALYELIYDVTERHMVAEAQPRKSIMMLDAMVGWHRYAKRKMNKQLLADVLYEQRNINISFAVNASSIRKELNKHVFAQEYATRAVEQRLQLSVAGLGDPNKPQGSFLLTGSTGVGKTELVKQLARILFPEGTDALIRLDMTEYANPDSLERFRLELTSAVSVQPYCIILLDEIEKACAPVTRILLSVLDDARLTDRHGRIVSFVNSYIVLTTNAGSEIYKTIAQYESSDDGSGEFVSRYDKLIRRSLMATTGGNRFPPELLGRIDTIVPFQPLSESTMERICKYRIGELRTRLLNMYGVDMQVSKRVVQYLIKDSLTTDSDSGGARAVVSKLESEVTTNVASFINRFPSIRSINVDIHGELASENKSKLTSDAYVVVRGVEAG
jgi:ATP-dependent Clp protease ATP-binding subunit ClpC